MSNNIGQRVANVEAEQPWLPITQVKVKKDQSNTYTAGDTTGRTFEVECAIGSQEIADNLLAALNGYIYQAYNATDALIKPNIELGQSVSVGDVYSIVGSIVIKGDMILAADLSAPSSGELDHEYPYDQWKRVIVDAKNIRHGGGHGTVSGLAVTPETINWVQLAENAVTSTKLAIAAVQSWAIEAGAVTNNACDSIVNQSLADADYSADVFSGAVTASFTKVNNLYCSGTFKYNGKTFSPVVYHLMGYDGSEVVMRPLRDEDY